MTPGGKGEKHLFESCWGKEVAERLGLPRSTSLPFPSDLFSGQNGGTGGKTSKCPLPSFLKDLPTAHPVEEMCGRQGSDPGLEGVRKTMVMQTRSSAG